MYIFSSVQNQINIKIIFDLKNFILGYFELEFSKSFFINAFIKNDFENSNSKYPSIKFFRSNIILIFIWFWTLEKMYNKENLNIEQLIEDIPRGFGSRPTIFKFINLAIKKNIC